MCVARAVSATVLACITAVAPVHAQQRGIELSDGRIISPRNVDPSAALLLLNGATTTLDALSQLDSDMVESIEVLQGPAATELYGPQAAAGAIVFITSDFDQASGARDAAAEPARVMLLRGAAAAVLVLLDGEPSTLGEIQALDPESIESIEVIKGAAARSLYGDGAEAGVVRVIRVSPPSR
jgi:outer membrane receptor protein involved in Fe transport